MRKFSRSYLALSVILLLLAASQTSAHHSFAVHFESDETVQVKGIVESFRFSNPHGILTFKSIDEAGQPVAWRAETNSPNVLRRRGWDRESLKPGDEITVTGFPARDGTSYMRISRIVFADGRELIGQAVAPAPDEED